MGDRPVWWGQSVDQRARETWIPTAQDHKCSARSRQSRDKSWCQCEDHYTTKACSCCRRTNRSITSEKVFSCSHCSLTIDRDVNAARNIYLKNEHLLTRAPGVRVPGGAYSAVSGARELAHTHRPRTANGMSTRARTVLGYLMVTLGYIEAILGIYRGDTKKPTLRNRLITSAGCDKRTPTTFILGCPVRLQSGGTPFVTRQQNQPHTFPQSTRFSAPHPRNSTPPEAKRRKKPKPKQLQQLHCLRDRRSAKIPTTPSPSSLPVPGGRAWAPSAPLYDSQVLTDSDDESSGMYAAVSETDPMLSPSGGKSPSGSNTVRSMRLETPTPKCNDMFFAVLFLANVVGVGVLAFWKGLPALRDQLREHENPGGEPPQDFSMALMLVSVLVATGVGLSMVWMKLLMAYAASMIRVALWLNVGLVLVFAVTTFAASPIMALVFLFLAAINVWYIYAVQNRIGFASANLKAACAAVGDHSAVFVVALVLVLQQTLWLALWGLSAMGVHQLFLEADPNCDRELQRNFAPGKRAGSGLCGGPGAGFTLFFMLVSVYWGQQVLQNILTCTTAGVVATWWYQPGAQKATVGALYRSMTTSFGSICFGSLIVAVLQALRTMADMAKQRAREEESAALACFACLAECILSCLANIMEYINQWAYVYVGIYGYAFRTSGKAVMDLFNNRGWTAVINDDLTSSALTLGAMGVGVITCCIGLLMTKFAPTAWFAGFGSSMGVYGAMGMVGFMSGMSMAMILAQVVIAALHTIFVCFAEDPIAFNRNHPKEYGDLVAGWRQFHGDVLVSAFGSAV